MDPSLSVPVGSGCCCWCLVEFVFLDRRVDCAKCRKCPVGHDFAQSDCGVILRFVVFVPHSDEDPVRPKHCPLGEVSGFTRVMVVLLDESVVFSLWPCLRHFVVDCGVACLSVRHWQSQWLCECWCGLEPLVVMIVFALYVCGRECSCHS